MLINTLDYCQNCKEIKKKYLCNFCIHDDYVTINYNDALRLYKTKHKDKQAYKLLQIPIKDQFDTFIVMKNDFEEYSLNIAKSVHIEKLRNKRLELKNKYVLLRGELIELLNKFHYEDTDFIVLTDYASTIKIYCDVNMNIIDATNAIYYSIKDQLVKNISIAKRKKILNDALYKIFLPKEYYYLITTEKYENVINTLKTSDEMTAYVSKSENLCVFQNIMKKKIENDLIVMYVENYSRNSEKVSIYVKIFNDSKCEKVIKNYVNDNITMEMAISQITNIIDRIKRKKLICGLISRILYDRYRVYENKLSVHMYRTANDFYKTQKIIYEDLTCARDYVNCKDINLIDTRRIKSALRVELAKKIVPLVKKIIIHEHFLKYNMREKFEKYIDEDPIIKKFINEPEYKEYFKELKCLDPKDYHHAYVTKNGELCLKHIGLPEYIKDHLKLIQNK